VRETEIEIEFVLVLVLGMVVVVVKVKISRRRRASVVLPEEEGPERPRRRGGIVEGIGDGGGGIAGGG
jgi:hypothetical protein